VRADALVAGGRASEVKAGGAHELLLQAAERSLRSAKFAAACEGSRFEVVFIFKIEGEETAVYDLGTVTFSWPNQFAVTVRPPKPQP
jgi:hypothetical protein